MIGYRQRSSITSVSRQIKVLEEKRSYGVKDTSKDSQSMRSCSERRQIQCVTIKSSQSDWLKSWGFRIDGYCIPLNARKSVEPTKSKNFTYLVLSSTGVSRRRGTVRKSKARKVVGASNWYECKNEACKKVKRPHGRWVSKDRGQNLLVFVL